MSRQGASYKPNKPKKRKRGSSRKGKHNTAKTSKLMSNRGMM